MQTKIDTKQTSKYIDKLYNTLESTILSKLCSKLDVKDILELTEHKDRIRIENNNIFVDDKLFINFTDMSIANHRVESRSVDLGVNIKVYG